jgi:hypothetical protein
MTPRSCDAPRVLRGVSYLVPVTRATCAARISRRRDNSNPVDTLTRLGALSPRACLNGPSTDHLSHKADGPGVMSTRPALTIIRPREGIRWLHFHISRRRWTPKRA